jgi:hypothetical protein
MIGVQDQRCKVLILKKKMTLRLTHEAFMEWSLNMDHVSLRAFVCL